MNENKEINTKNIHIETKENFKSQVYQLWMARDNNFVDVLNEICLEEWIKEGKQGSLWHMSYFAGDWVKKILRKVEDDKEISPEWKGTDIEKSTAILHWFAAFHLTCAENADDEWLKKEFDDDPNCLAGLKDFLADQYPGSVKEEND